MLKRSFGAFLHWQEHLRQLDFVDHFLTKSRFRYAYLLCGMLCILIWQLQIKNASLQMPEKYGRHDASGFSYWHAENFTYFYYYLDLFPLATYNRPLVYSKAGAQEQINLHGDSLVNEVSHWSRLGENARIFLYLPDMWWNGTAEKPSIMLFNAILFILSLEAIFLSLFLCGQGLLAIAIVLVFGSSPFLLYESYTRLNNIFAFTPALFLLLSALFLPLVLGRLQSLKYWILVVFLSALIIGTAIHVRGEAQMLLLSCLLLTLILKNTSWKQRILMAGLLLAIFLGVKKAWLLYFDFKFEQARELTENAGGNPYNGPRLKGHRFWHPVWCGLGDFDKTHGYAWSDEVAYAYAVPILKKEYGMDLPYTYGKFYPDVYLDSARKYYLKFDLIDEYEEVLKKKVLSDIKNEPRWYLDILWKRIDYSLCNSSPLWLKWNWGHWSFSFYRGWLALLLVPLLFFLCDWRLGWWVISAFPLGANAILICCTYNSCYTAIFHLVCAALAFTIVLKLLFFSAKAMKKGKLTLN